MEHCSECRCMVVVGGQLSASVIHNPCCGSLLLHQEEMCAQSSEIRDFILWKVGKGLFIGDKEGFWRRWGSFMCWISTDV